MTSNIQEVEKNARYILAEISKNTIVDSRGDYWFSLELMRAWLRPSEDDRNEVIFIQGSLGVELTIEFGEIIDDGLEDFIIYDYRYLDRLTIPQFEAAATFFWNRVETDAHNLFGEILSRYNNTNMPSRRSVVLVSSIDEVRKIFLLAYISQLMRNAPLGSFFGVKHICLREFTFLRVLDPDES